MTKFTPEDYIQFIAGEMKRQLKEGIKRPKKLVYDCSRSVPNDFDKVHSVIVPGPWDKEK